MPTKDSSAAPSLPVEIPLRRGPVGSRSSSRWVKLTLLLVFFLVLGAALAAGFGFRLVSNDFRAPQPPETSAMDIVRPAGKPLPVLGLARLMPDGDLIRVSTPYGAGDARVSAIHVSPGDQVEAGTVLATLDNRAALESRRLGALALVAQREAALLQAREAVRLGLMEAHATVAEAEAGADATRVRLDRARALAERGIAAVATLEALQAEAEQAAQVVVRAQAALARWETDDIAVQPDVLVAQRSLEAALIDADRAVLDLSQSEVRAPVAGTVLQIDIRPGERPGSDGLMTLGQIDRMVARAEVFQSEIGRVRKGQSVKLTAAPLAMPLTGSVERIGLLVGRQSLVSDDTAANTDARVVELIVRLDPESSDRAAGLSNLETVAWITVESAP